MKITVRIKRPKFYDYFTVSPVTERTCSVEECSAPAPHIQGYYLVESRRVRVWVCRSHYTGHPQLVLPTPASIVAAIKAEAEYMAAQEKRLSWNVDSERGESIKTLGASGHGLPIPGDRVKQWRWGA